MLKSQIHFGYNRYRATQDPRARRLMDFVHGVPDGHRTAGQTSPETLQYIALERAGALIAQGVYVNQPIACWGDDPVTMLQVWNNQGQPLGASMDGLVFDAQGVPDMSMLTPAKDMIVPATAKPFSPWGHRPTEDGDAIENNGVGFLYPSNPGDTYDVGAWQTTADGKKYEKVAWNGPYGHVIIEWERIA